MRGRPTMVNPVKNDSETLPKTEDDEFYASIASAAQSRSSGSTQRRTSYICDESGKVWIIPNPRQVISHLRRAFPGMPLRPAPEKPSLYFCDDVVSGSFLAEG